MSNFSTYVNLVAKALEDDDALREMVDGQIIPGFRRSQADSYLEGENGACIGIRSLSKNSQGLPGCYYHGISKQDHLLEIRVISLLTATRQDDSYAAAIGSRIEDLLKGGITKTLNGVQYQAAVGPINFTPLDDDQFNDRIEIQATVRIKYYG